VLEAAVTRPGATQRPVSGRTLLIAMGSLLVTAIVLTLANASIYGDGSWYLVSLIHLGHPRPIAGREAVNYLKELPAWLGLKAGSSDVHTLTLLQSLGFIWEPLVAWCAALWAARRSAWLCSLVLLAAASGFGTCMIFNVNELNLTLALLVLVLVSLADEAPWSTPRTVVCMLAALVLVWAYEFMVAWGPLLAWYAMLRCRQWRQAGNQRMARLAAAIVVLAIAAILMAIYTLVFHTSPNAEGFGSGLVGKPYTAGTQVIGACLLIVAAALWAQGEGDSGRTGARDGQGRRRAWAAGLCFLAAVLLLVHSILVWGRPGVSYTARSWPSVFVLAIQLVLILCLLSPRISQLLTRSGRRLLPLALGFCVLSMISPVLFGVGFHSFTNDIRAKIDAHPGQSIAPQRSVATGQQKYLWTWANESLSLLLRARAQDGIVLNDQVKGGWLPFPSADVHRQIAPRYHW
jgi:hypothetical protein